jgi:hypothetical protein
MPRPRSVLAFVAGAIVVIGWGLVPSEVIGWLQSWAALGEDPDRGHNDDDVSYRR